MNSQPGIKTHVQSGVMRRSLAYAVLGVVAIVAWALSGEIGRYVGQSAVENYRRGKEQGTLEKVQEVAAKELRKQLPIQIDELTTLQTVINLGTTLQYQYRVMFNKTDINLNIWHNEMKRTLQTNVCNNSNMRFVLDNGGSYQYSYIGINGIKIDEIVISSPDC